MPAEQVLTYLESLHTLVAAIITTVFFVTSAIITWRKQRDDLGWSMLVWAWLGLTVEFLVFAITYINILLGLVASHIPGPIVFRPLNSLFMVNVMVLLFFYSNAYETETEDD